jgi:hypothetical protein
MKPVMMLIIHMQDMDDINPYSRFFCSFNFIPSEQFLYSLYPV